MRDGRLVADADCRYLCGACALVPIGLIVGSAARDIRTAPAIANLLFFPLMFLSGSAMPFAFLPDGVNGSRDAADDVSQRDLWRRDRARRRLWTLAGSLAVLLGSAPSASS